MSSDEFVGRVYIVSPIDSDGEPIPLYFTVTEGGYLLHLEKMDADSDKKVDKATMNAELAKLRNGLDSTTGRFNEFVKNRSNYKIKMAMEGLPITIADARRMDEKYWMGKEERIRAIEKEKELWMR